MGIVKEHEKELHDLVCFTSKHPNDKRLQPTVSLETLELLAAEINDWYQAVVKALISRAGIVGCVTQKAPIKSHMRSKEKLVRSYKGNVSFLMDIVRSTIAVDNVKDAHDVLVVILKHCRVHM